MMKWLMYSILIFVLIPSAYADLHDPTRPAQYVENQANVVDISKLELTLTLVSPERNTAVINGIPVNVGDKIGNQWVDSIELNSVRLTGPSGNITLFLLNNSVKKPVQ